MNHALTTVLVVEDDPADARRIAAALSGAQGSAFRAVCVRSLGAALERIGKGA